MTPKDRAAAEELLKEATEALKTLAAAKGKLLEEKTNRLFREVAGLRRQLSEGVMDSVMDEPADATACSALNNPGRPPLSEVITGSAPHDAEDAQRPRSWRTHWLKADQAKDSALHPIVRLVICGLCILAWMIQPETTDSSGATTLLMFLRFVPIFIIGGSLHGCARKGALIGVALFFTLLGLEALSIVIWDVHLPESALKMVRHAGVLANLLYGLALVGLLLCGAVTFAVRRERRKVSERYLRLAMQVLVMVQLALVVEIGYTGLRHAIGADRNNAGTIETLMKLSHNSHRR